MATCPFRRGNQQRTETLLVADDKVIYIEEIGLDMEGLLLRPVSNKQQ